MKRLAIFVFVAVIAVLFMGQSPPNSSASYAYISSTATSIVKATPGFLHTVTINGGTAGAVTLYDIGSAGCTGTPGSGKFATIEAIPASGSSPLTLTYDVHTLNGICVVTAANTDLTLSFN